jgi:hypothetical protein
MKDVRIVEHRFVTGEVAWGIQEKNAFGNWIYLDDELVSTWLRVFRAPKFYRSYEKAAKAMRRIKQ